MKKIAVIVDDVEINRDILADMLDNMYEIREAANGRDALDIIHTEEKNVAVLLLDLAMPVLDGFGTLSILKSENLMEDFPVLIISGESDQAMEEKCLAMGVSDFIKKPFNPRLVRHRVNNSVSLFSYKNELEEKVREQAAAILEQNEKLKDANRKTTDLLGTVVEARNKESGTHVRRVKSFTKILTECVREKYPEYGIKESEQEYYEDASVLHDLGKIMISDSILLKPGKLTEDEFEEMKRHTLYGCDVLENVKQSWNTRYYELAYDVCRYHHEKWDGRGYPCGLKGDEIPIVAQIVSVADCYDALTTRRPYKVPFSHDKAYEMIMNGECGAFNPKLLDCFTICREVFRVTAEAIKEE